MLEQLRITMLNSSNGHRWIQEITSAFYKSNTHSVALGQKPKPLGSADVVDDITRNREEIAIDKWLAADSMANALIHDSLSPDYRSSFKWDRSSHENFKLFKKIAQDNSPAAIRDLKKDLEDLKQEVNEEIMDYYNRWNSVLCRLVDAGGSLLIREQVELFLGTTTDRYDPVKGSVDLGQLPDNYSMEKLLTRLKDFTRMTRGRRSHEVQGDSIMQVDGNSPRLDHGTSPNKEFTLQIVCYNCGGYSHYFRNCSSPKRGKDIKVPHLGPIIE